MKTLIPCLLACVLAACSAANNDATTPAGNQTIVDLPPVDATGAKIVAQQMLDAALTGETARVKELMVKAEREADGHGINININEKNNMAGYELGEPIKDGEFVVVPATIKYKDGAKDDKMDLVMQKEGEVWRVNMVETGKRGLKKKLGRD